VERIKYTAQKSCSGKKWEKRGRKAAEHSTLSPSTTTGGALSRPQPIQRSRVPCYQPESGANGDRHHSPTPRPPVPRWDGSGAPKKKSETARNIVVGNAGERAIEKVDGTGRTTTGRRVHLIEIRNVGDKANKKTVRHDRVVLRPSGLGQGKKAW